MGHSWMVPRRNKTSHLFIADAFPKFSKIMIHHLFGMKFIVYFCFSNLQVMFKFVLIPISNVALLPRLKSKLLFQVKPLFLFTLEALPFLSSIGVRRRRPSTLTIFSKLFSTETT